MNALHFSSVEIAGARDEDLFHNIEEHKFFINQTIPFEVSMEEAFKSWSLLVQAPLSGAISKAGLDRFFPELSKGELFLQVSNHWYFLKEKDDNLSAEEAVLSYGAKFAPDALTRFGFFLKKLAF